MEIDDLRSIYYQGLKQYLNTKNEEWLSKAFEQSQVALKAGISELDIVNLHHEILPEVLKEDSEHDDKSALAHASTYLMEWMVVYDVKVRSYRKLIKQLNKKNEVLKREIDQREKAQEELEESKEYFRSLIENAQDIITVLDEEGTVHYDTPSVYRILGYNRRELVGSNVFDFIHKEDKKEVEHAFLDTLRNSGKVVTVQFRFQHKNGSWVYLESIAKYVPDTPKGPVFIVNSRDVTKRHEHLRKLNEQRIKLAEAQRIAKVGSWEWNFNANDDESELEWSDELFRIFDLAPEEFDHQYETYISHVHPDDRERVENEIKNANKDEEYFSLQHRIIRSDGEVRHVSCRGRLLLENDEPFKMVGTIQDVTEQKEREEQLRIYSDKLRKLSERVERTREEERIRIAREIHDELGQMLTVLKIDMSMYKENIKRKVSEDLAGFFDDEMQQMMNRINTIIESVHRITTKLRPEVLDDLGLIEAIEWQAKELAKRIDLAVEVNSFLDNTKLISEDQKTTLFRVFQEAMNNIIRHAQATKVKIKLHKEHNDLLLTVKDNGIGITQEQKDARSSFGLIGMRERARFLGGDIHVEGDRDKGTRVTVKIPLNSNNDTNTEV